MHVRETLSFSDEWYIKSDWLPGLGVFWIAWHRHIGSKRSDGWYVKRGACCSHPLCRVVFPDKLLGMKNMMNAFETRR